MTAKKLREKIAGLNAEIEASYAQLQRMDDESQNVRKSILRAQGSIAAYEALIEELKAVAEE